MITATITPTYDDGIRDCAEIVEQLIPIAIDRDQRQLLSTMASQMRSLHSSTRPKRRSDIADTLMAVVDDFASRIVKAAVDDIEYSNQRYDSNGNVCANVSLSFPQTMRWVRYMATKGSSQARWVMNYVAAQRAPSLEPEHRECQMDTTAIHLPQNLGSP